MEAKDTINEELIPVCSLMLYPEELREKLALQAEITWKAREPEIAEARREVVEWIDHFSWQEPEGNVVTRRMKEREWQAFLKSKGIR